MTQPQLFDGLDEFYDLAETAPTVYEGEVFGHIEYDDGDEEWESFPYRRSLFIEGGGMVGDVSANEDYYNVIQYEDALDAIGAAFSTHDVEPRGYIQYSDSGHLLKGYADLPAAEVEVVDGDVIDLGLQFQIGQTGFHGVHYDVAGMREICSNGMKAPVSELEFSQTHQEPLQYSLPQQAVKGILDGTDLVEDRLQQAREQTFVTQDEALLTLLDIGLDQYFDNAVLILEECFEQETGFGQQTDDSQEVSLYETYNVATRALTHHAELDMVRRDQALDQAASLLDRAGELPDAAELGQAAIENRVRGYTDDEAEAYWDDERETLSDLIERRGDR